MSMKRIGYGQLEPNHLSAQRTGQIYAQLPADSSIKVLENGQFAKYNYADNKVNFEGEGEWMLVYNEVKLYDGYRETYKDFALVNTNYTENVMTPRLLKTNVGDIFTTNTLEKQGTKGAETETAQDYAVSDTLKINAQGFLEKGEPEEGDPKFQVVKVYTMPDGQEAVKVMRIK